jgi:myo-inositol-1(or 4)-monophosphatase
MNGEDWRRVLTDASKKVQRKVTRVAEHGEASKALKVGASGDTTLLADKEAENELFKALTRIEGLRIVSEEAGNWGDPEAKLVAIVDPLDGSSNFERRIPFYCTSVAVATGGSLKDVRFGLVRNLVNGDVYWAEKGKGCTKNGKRAAPSRVTSLSDTVMDADLSRASPELVADLGPLISAVKRQVHQGANALELCFVAEGRVDAFVDLRKKMRSTDFAAAYLIATEAGATITDPEGGVLDPELDLAARFSFVAANNKVLHRRILELLSG